jgi:hypothetical protein
MKIIAAVAAVCTLFAMMVSAENPLSLSFKRSAAAFPTARAFRVSKPVSLRPHMAHATAVMSALSWKRSPVTCDASCFDYHGAEGVSEEDTICLE